MHAPPWDSEKRARVCISVHACVRRVHVSCEFLCLCGCPCIFISFPFFHQQQRPAAEMCELNDGMTKALEAYPTALFRRRMDYNTGH